MSKKVRIRWCVAMAPVLLAISAACLGQSAVETSRSLDSIFQKWNKPDGPGCVLAVKRPNVPVLVRAFGAADLESGVAIDESTVFEAGSVSKQFTAAAILLLAAKGELALTDPVKKFLPEMPAYAARITIAELLGHTSGLRDWGGVEALAGWPRTSRVYTLDDVLAIAARQKSLNYPPGTAYSYTNTGYNLLAIIVARVSKQSLAEFTRDHLFLPLGMGHSQWRDDFTRIVKHRAIAYTPGSDGAYHQDMPFENAYGNGGLLTTVGDLLRWNDALAKGELGEFVSREIARQTTLAGGEPIAYARGLFVTSHHGVREISHSGATAGYRAWLGRFPDQQLSIALLCNAGNANTISLAYAVADQFLPAAPPQNAVSLSGEQLAEHVGFYLDRQLGLSVRLKVQEGALWEEGGLPLTAMSAVEFRSGSSKFRFTGNSLDIESFDGSVLKFTRTQPWKPNAGELASYVGVYSSEEALATYDVKVSGEGLVMTALDRAGFPIALNPVALDTFENKNIGMVHFIHEAAKSSTKLEMSNARVYSLGFQRTTAHAK